MIETIGRERLKIEEVLDDNPSLRAELAEVTARAHRYGAKSARLGLERYGELKGTTRQDLQATRYTADEVTGDWLPPPPAA